MSGERAEIPRVLSKRFGYTKPLFLLALELIPGRKSFFLTPRDSGSSCTPDDLIITQKSEP